MNLIYNPHVGLVLYLHACNPAAFMGDYGQIMVSLTSIGGMAILNSEDFNAV